MKKLCLVMEILILLGMVIAITGCSSGSKDKDKEVLQNTGNTEKGSSYESDSSAVSFETIDLEGNSVTSGSLFSGSKLTMINIWCTYCGPCINEMPELEKIHQEYASQGVCIAGLAADVPAGDDSLLEEAKEIVKATGITYPNLRAWEGCQDVLPATAVPTTYFFDENGMILGEPVVGANVQKYRSMIEEYLGKSAKTSIFIKQVQIAGEPGKYKASWKAAVKKKKSRS